MFSLVLLASMLAPQGPTGPTLHYKFESKATTSVDLSAMGQGTQSMDMGSAIWFAVTMSDSAGGRIARVVIDSGKVDAGQLAAMLPDSMLRVKPGAVMRLFVLNGKVTPLGGIENVGMAGAQLLPGLQMMFPSFPVSRAKVGATWADTVKADTSMTMPDSSATPGAGMSLGSKSITVWTVTADQGDAYLLDAVVSGTTTMNMMGNEVQGTTNFPAQWDPKLGIHVT